VATVDNKGLIIAVSPGTAKITVANGPSFVAPLTVLPAISIMPRRRDLHGLQSQRFTARAGYADRVVVNWSINPAGAGSIDNTGLYTAPASIPSQQAVTVTATSVADSTKSASVNVTLYPPTQQIPGGSINLPYRGALTFLDPVPDLLSGNDVTTDPESLATGGTPVTGIVADGVARVVLRFPARFAGEALRVTLLNDRGQTSSSSEEDGTLAGIAHTGPSPAPVPPGTSAPVQITAVATSQGPMAFAIYRSPADFNRNGKDDGAARSISFQVQSLSVQGPPTQASFTMYR
jgi:hypothetical protein